MSTDDIEKLSCKEEIFEVSDVEPSASDDSKINEGKTKKRRRRRREIDLMSEGDETEDEGLNKKLYRRLSPASGPHSPASHREPRTCVLKVKGPPLSKDETKVLLELIESSNILASKDMNASTNRMKVAEWDRITAKFNATAASCRRTPQQLRLKWENLKKNARRRTTLIKLNRSQADGKSSQHIAPDDILDRVSVLLDEKGSRISTPIREKRRYAQPLQPKYKQTQDNWVAARNQAMAEYYTTKKQYLLAKMHHILLENKKLKLEVESLRNHNIS